jgi:SAM-dependent methyltransferase
MDPYKWNDAAYPESRCTSDDIRVQRIMPLIGKVGKVLDVGCLDGTIGMVLRDLGNTVSGIDASQTAVAKAKERGIDARVGNVEEPLPFPDGTFDLVFAGEIIEHIFDIDHLFAEMHRVMKPHGSLVVTTPNLAAFGRRLLLLVNRNPNIEISFTGKAAGHIRYFIKSSLFGLLEKHSFMPVQFTSDVVNFNRKGTVSSQLLARAFPTLGRSLIVKAERRDLSAMRP